MNDLLIKNGMCYDTEKNCLTNRTIAVKNGLIIENQEPAKFEIDAEGAYVIPGLIDFHAHVYHGGSEFGVSPDLLLANGVTTVVDAGSTGCANFEAFYRSICAVSRVRVKAQINLYAAGQPGYGIVEDLTPEKIDRKALKMLFRKYPDTLNGLKIRLAEEVVGDLGIRPLEAALELADDLEVPLVVHASNPPCEAAEIVKRLRPGDVFCHCYHEKGRTILDSDGNVQSSIWEARKRGILFDASNGITNFSTRVAQRALADGFFPDIISTDEGPNVFNKNGFAKNLPYIMSKYVELGMSLEEIFKAVTITPAKWLKLSGETGALLAGRCADIAILKLVPKKTIYRDNKGNLLKGHQLFEPQMTIKDGAILYCKTGFPEEC